MNAATLARTGLWAGACEVDTTPALGTDLGGYLESRLADRYERPLLAKALALQSDGTVILLISVDIIMMRAQDMVDAAKTLITKRTGIPADHVMISATHTHFGPATIERPGGPVVDRTHLTRVVAAIAEAGTGAVTTLRPARIGFGQAPVTGVCFNRRYRLANGLVQCNPGRGREDVVGPAGPIDPTVTGLVVEDRDGKPFAFWANLSLHYVDAETPTSISADYFGAFSQRLSALVGAPLQAQLTNGCSGDINNIDLSSGVAERGSARADLVATAVAGAAAAGAIMGTRHTEVELTSRLDLVELERVDITADDLRIAHEVLAGTRDDAPFSYVHGMPIPADQITRRAERLLVLAEAPKRQRVPVMVMTIGQLCIVGLPGEIFVEHGLTIRRNSRHRITAVVGLANDHIGYVPTEQGCRDGGFEAWRDHISWTAPGSGERLVERALALMGRPTPED